MDIGNFLGGSMILMALLGIAYLALLIYAVVDLVQRPIEPTTKVLWALGIFFFPLIGSIVYLIVGRAMRGRAV
jgi:hypothetical protein